MTAHRAPRGGAGDLSVARRILQGLDRIAGAMAWLSGALFLLTSLYVTADVVGRKFLGVSSAVSDEVGGYALALGGMWAVAYALRRGAHVRIDVLLPHLPGPVQAVLHYAALLVMALFAAVLAFYTWRLTLDSLALDARAMSIMRTPLAVPQGLMAVGLAMLVLEALAILLVGAVESARAGRLVPPEGTQAGAGDGP